LAILHAVLAAARDPRLTRTDINTVATMASFADNDGIVGNDDHGRSMSDTRIIAEALGAGPSTVSRSLTHLEQLGYVEWNRAWSAEKRTPIAGASSRVRIIPSSTPSA
jgi:hypothetical protein